MINCGALRASADFDGTRTSVFVGISFTRKLVLILGSMYGGEMKKAIFSVMNYLLPQRDVLPMHCSANVGETGDVALFFGLSGTGKTTLSADPARRLIGDDEHGWSDHSVFNFEGGCYAKTIRLSQESEPQIYNAIKFGSILENVIVDPQTRAIDYDSDFLTENTRATYPIDHIPSAVLGGVGDHPRNVFFLTCDAFGVLPPISRLTPEMASYHFLSGFTSKVAGTEVGVDEPRPTFSTCFGAPFMPLHASRYATMLAERLSLARDGLLAGEHRLDRRTVRRRPPHEHRPDASAARGGPGRLARRGRVHAASRLQGARAAASATCRRGRARPARHLGRRGRVRRGGPPAGRHVPRQLRAVRFERVARGAGGRPGPGRRLGHRRGRLALDTGGTPADFDRDVRETEVARDARLVLVGGRGLVRHHR